MDFLVRKLIIEKNTNFRKFLGKELLGIKFFKKLYLDTDEFIRSAREIGFEVSEESLGAIFNQFDADSDGFLDEKEATVLAKDKMPDMF